MSIIVMVINIITIIIIIVCNIIIVSYPDGVVLFLVFWYVCSLSLSLCAVGQQ